MKSSPGVPIALGAVAASGLVRSVLPRCIGQVIIPAHNVRDVHHGVIDDDGEVVCRIAVRSEYNHIVQYVVVEDDLALDQIIDNRLAKKPKRTSYDSATLPLTSIAEAAETHAQEPDHN